MTTDKAIEVANKIQLSDNPLWLEVKCLACDYEKQIAELEQKLEQTEKDLSDYQFNYPTIKELQKENAELKDINTHTLSQLNLTNVELILQLAKAKELLNDFICYANLDDCNLYIKEQAKQFLKEFAPPKV